MHLHYPTKMHGGQRLLLTAPAGVCHAGLIGSRMGSAKEGKAMTTKAQLKKLDDAVLTGMQAHDCHGAVKWIRYAANETVTGERFGRTPYSEAQVRGSLKRLEKADKVENHGWSKARWRVITDEMRAKREAARQERARWNAEAAAIQKALGLGMGGFDADGDPDGDEHVTPTKHGGLELSPRAVAALAEILNVNVSN